MSSPKKDQQPKPIKYKKVEIASGSEAEDNSGVDNTDNTANRTSNNTEASNVTKIKSCHDLWKYITTNPLSKLPFLYFCMSIIIIILFGIWYFMDSDTSFIISGLFGILTSVYALNHFRMLINLRIQVDKYFKLNKHFSSENAQLAHEVDKLSSASNQLQVTHDKLKTINTKTKENNQKFRELQKTLKTVTFNNIQGINEIRDKANKISDDWNQKVLQRERDVLYKIYERFEKPIGNDEGMSRKQFDEFLILIPDAYKVRFDRLGTFEKLARGTNYINYKDFGACLDVFAMMNVENCDIEFEIEEINEDDEKEMDIMPTLVRGRPSYGGRKINIIRKTEPGMTFDQTEIVFQFDNDELNGNSD